MKFFVMSSLNRPWGWISYLFLTLASGMFTSCLNTEYKMESAIEPILEAFIEYPGPQAQWAGPEAHLLHIHTAKGGSDHLAQAVWSHGSTHTELVGNARLGPHSDEVREALQNIADSIKNPIPTFQDCLSPIRIRFIYEKGNVVHAQACQGQKGWPQEVHTLAARWMEIPHRSSTVALQK